MINEKVDRILDIFTGGMCYHNDVEPGSESYLMAYNAKVAFNSNNCTSSHCYYYNYYIYVSMIKEEVLY